MGGWPTGKVGLNRRPRRLQVPLRAHRESAKEWPTLETAYSFDGIVEELEEGQETRQVQGIVNPLGRAG
jgi:hypothetical protein